MLHQKYPGSCVTQITLLLGICEVNKLSLFQRHVSGLKVHCTIFKHIHGLFPWSNIAVTRSLLRQWVTLLHLLCEMLSTSMQNLGGREHGAGGMVVWGGTVQEWCSCSGWGSQGKQLEIAWDWAASNASKFALFGVMAHLEYALGVVPCSKILGKHFWQ